MEGAEGEGPATSTGSVVSPACFEEDLETIESYEA